MSPFLEDIIKFNIDRQNAIFMTSNNISIVPIKPDYISNNYDISINDQISNSLFIEDKAIIFEEIKYFKPYDYLKDDNINNDEGNFILYNHHKLFFININ